MGTGSVRTLNRQLGAILLIAVALVLARLPLIARAADLDAISKAAEQYHGPSPDTAQLYSQCLLSTVRYDVRFTPDKTTYVITGDIGAMWLRDASAQVRPYSFFARRSSGQGHAAWRDRAVGQGHARRPVCERIQPRLPGHGREIRARLAGLSDGLGLDYWKQTGDTRRLRRK